MSVRIISASALESEIYATVPQVRNAIDRVGDMIMDLHDEPIDLDILYVINDSDNPGDFTLAFSGSTLSLEISQDGIEVWDYDEVSGGECLQTFKSDNINAATTWLVNRIEE
jgi:hypothetical protein